MQPAAPPPASPPPAPKATPPPPRRSAFKRVLLIVLLLACAYLGGFAPQWLMVHNLRAQLEQTNLQLRLANAHRALGVASHEAQRSNYANAAQAAAVFFDSCATLARTDAFEKEQRTRVALLSYTAQRDEIMSMLSAGDPAARERLASLYLTMDGVLQRRE